MPCLRLRLRTPVSACVSRLRLRVPSSDCSPLAALTAIKAIATSTEPEREVYWRLYKIIKRFAYAWAHDCILVSLSLSLPLSLSLAPSCRAHCVCVPVPDRIVCGLRSCLCRLTP